MIDKLIIVVTIYFIFSALNCLVEIYIIVVKHKIQIKRYKNQIMFEEDEE